MEATVARSAPLFNRQRLTALIWPMLIEQVLSVTMGMADTLMVSGVGEAAVSSVSLVDSINVLIIQILSALATGGAVIGSQYLGRRDAENARRSAAQLYTVLAVSTLSVMVLALCFCRPILRLVFGRIEDDVMGYAETYFILSALSYPFLGFYNAGAALATLVGRVFAAVWVFWQQQQFENPLRIAHLADMRPERGMILRILGIGIPSGLENGMFQIGKLCVSSLTSTLGTSAIAANAVANSISGLANIPGNTMSLAMIPVVGQCLGAGDKRQAKRYAMGLWGLAMAGLAVTNTALFLGAPALCRLYNLSTEATVMCEQVLHWFAVFSIFFWATSFTLPNALRAGGDAKYTMTVSIISMWLFRVMLSYYFVLQMDMGLLGVWLGMFIDWIFRGILFVVRFVRGRWMNHKVI